MLACASMHGNSLVCPALLYDFVGYASILLTLELKNLKRDGIEAIILAGIVIFTIANGILCYESVKQMHNNEMLNILKRIDKKLTNAKHKS